MKSCPKCQGSKIVKRGIQVMSGGKKCQRYQCKDCGKYTLVSIEEAKG